MESRIVIAATEPCVAFRQDAYENGHFIGSLTGIEKALASATNPQQPEPEPLATEWFARYRERLLEMVLQRQVDQYLTYLSHLLTLLFRSRPETLRAGPPSQGGQPETVPLDDLFRYGTTAEVLNRVIERRVQSLAYKGMTDLAQYLENRLGFNLFPDRETQLLAVVAIEIRNLIAHNRGVVNATFLARVAGSSWPFPPVGMKIELGFDLHYAMMGFFDVSAADIDARAIEKWNLPTVRLAVGGDNGPEVVSPPTAN